MRPLIAMMLTGGLALAGLAVPVLTLPVAAAEPVEAELTSIPVDGIDSEAVQDPSFDDTPEHDVHGKAAESDLAALSALEYTGSFMAAGVTWDAETSEIVTDVSVRVLDDGDWGQWESLEIENSGVPGERAGTQPLLTLNATGIQARVHTESGEVPGGLQIDTVDPGTSPADGRAPSQPAASASAATGNEIKPAIVTRAGWGADESRAAHWPDLSANLNAVYVHHTAGTNDYSRAEAAAMVRGVYGFHTGARGWPDIGYQFLVDKYGTIYQGRIGAIDDLPVGAQAGGFNTTTIGVSALGNYDIASPSTKLVRGIEQLVAWKAFQNGLNPRGTASLIAGMSTGTSMNVPPGSEIKVPAVLGHRDTNGTACPGKNLFAKLPTIRTRAGEAVDRAVAKHGPLVDALAAPSPGKATAEQFPAQVDSKSRYRWDRIPGAVAYQVLTRSAKHGSEMPDDRGWVLDRTVDKPSAEVTVSQGQTMLVAVRGIDAAGVRGPVGRIIETTRPVSTPTIVWAAKKWARESGTGQVNGQLRTTTKRGATLRVDHVRDARQIIVFGQSGPGYGKTEVMLGKRVLGTLDWNSEETEPRARRVLQLKKAVTGSIRLRSTNTFRVGISALAFSRAEPELPIPPVTPPRRITTPVLVKDRKYDFPVRLSESLTFRWKPVTGAVGYRIDVKKAKHGGGFSNWTRIGRTTATNLKQSIPEGETWYVSVRAIDMDNEMSKRSTYAKVTRPVSVKSMERSIGSKKWATIRKTAYFRNLAFSTISKGATIRVREAKDVRTVQVTAVTGKDYGRFAVYVAGKKVRTFSTASKKAKGLVRYTVEVPKSSGTVTIKTLDQGKRVRISAVTTAR